MERLVTLRPISQPFEPELELSNSLLGVCFNTGHLQGKPKVSGVRMLRKKPKPFFNLPLLRQPRTVAVVVYNMQTTSRPASTSTRPAHSPLPRLQVNSQTKVLDTTHGRILCIADIRGRLSALNDLAREVNAKAIIHTGDFGFFGALFDSHPTHILIFLSQTPIVLKGSMTVPYAILPCIRRSYPLHNVLIFLPLTIHPQSSVLPLTSNCFPSSPFCCPVK